MPIEGCVEKWIDVDGIRTRYLEAGSGVPVVLMHGSTIGDPSGPGNAEEWEMNIPVLARHHRVIAVDRLGQGMTDNPKRDEDYTMKASAEHIAGFLRALGLGPVHLIGHSRGGYIAIRVTLFHPRLVKSCIPIDTGTTAPGNTRNEMLFALCPHPPGTREALQWVLEAYSWRHDHITREMVDLKLRIAQLPKSLEASRKMSTEGLRASHFAPDLVADKELLYAMIERDGIQRPVLLLWAQNDPTAPIEGGLKLYDMIRKTQPRTEFHIVNQSGHFSFREQPEAFNRVMLEFIASVEHGN